MAKCPKCGKQWQWGWCSDTYRCPDIKAKRYADKSPNTKADEHWCLTAELSDVPEEKRCLYPDAYWPQTPDDDDDLGGHIYVCQCGQQLGYDTEVNTYGTLVSGEHGLVATEYGVANCPEWKDIDWDSKEHAYDGD